MCQVTSRSGLHVPGFIGLQWDNHDCKWREQKVRCSHRRSQASTQQLTGHMVKKQGAVHQSRPPQARLRHYRFSLRRRRHNLWMIQDKTFRIKVCWTKRRTMCVLNLKTETEKKLINDVFSSETKIENQLRTNLMKREKTRQQDVTVTSCVSETKTLKLMIGFYLLIITDSSAEDEQMNKEKWRFSLKRESVEKMRNKYNNENNLELKQRRGRVHKTWRRRIVSDIKPVRTQGVGGWGGGVTL